MRGAATAVLGLAAGFGLGLLALSVFHITTVGNCASGPTPFQIANRCPSNDSYWTGALVAGLLISIVAVGLLGLGITVPAIFFTVGVACVVSLATWDVNPDWVIAAIILPVLFFPLGGWMALSMGSPPSRKSLALVPAAALGAAGAVWAALAIPGPVAQPKGAAAAVSPAERITDVAAAAEVNRRIAYVIEHLGPSVGVSQISLKPGDTVLVVLNGGKRHDVHFEGDGSVQEGVSEPSGDRSVPLSSVDTRAPARALAEVQRRFGIGLPRVESLYFGIDSSGAAHWYVNLKRTTTYFQGGPHGTGLRRLHD